MTTVYVMEAKENYDPTRAAEADGAGFPTPTFTDTHLLGFGYDSVRRELVYAVIIEQPSSGGVITNASGHTLWDGVNSVNNGASTISGGPNAGDPFEAASNWNFYLARKNIDTGAVVFHAAYDVAQTVPVGIGPGGGGGVSDGTWRRFVVDTAETDQYPVLSDPRTGDAWVHQESCELYVFRASDNYAQAISPIRPTLHDTNPVAPRALTDDWTYAIEFGDTNPSGGRIYLIPRLTTAAETAADVLLAYATYDMPFSYFIIGTNQQFVVAIANDGAMYLFAASITGAAGAGADFRLFKFTPPSAFVYPTPPIDGGIADITPWVSATGPNAPLNGQTPSGGQVIRVGAWFSPGRTQLNLLSVAFADDFAVYDDANTSVVHTWYDTGTAAWASTTIANGYMKADFTIAATPEEAAFVLTGQIKAVNTRLEADAFYDASEYASRWFFFQVFAIAAGVVDYGAKRQILVRLAWNAHAAPSVAQVIDEAGWDTAYAAYGTAIGQAGVVDASIQSFDLSFGIGLDAGIFDAQTGAFWWSGMNTDTGTNDNMFQLDPAFTGRIANNAQPPILRLSFTDLRAQRSQGSIF